ncbi:MAG: uracil-DNA glycosylase [Planctomycetaceae bacterium]
MTSDRPVRQYLQLLKSAGISHIPTVKLPARTAETGARRGGVTSRSAAPRSAGTPATQQPVPTAPKTLRSPGELLPESAQVPEMLEETKAILAQSLKTKDQKGAALCELSALVSGCRRCSELANTRTQTVFGVGDPNARIMFVGEAPGADEDKQGEPFVGRAGQLLDKIIEASKLKRKDIYICNILRCRPPGNRNPLPQEAANCREYLDAQISIVQPEYIICWGTVAAQNLLNERRTIGKLRGQFLTYRSAKVLCTYHPSYLLRNPSAKKDVWADMKLFMAELGVTLD